MSLAASTFLLSCSLFHGDTRKGAAASCKSDHDCLFGLVCRGTDPAKVETRRCVYEQFSACASARQCYPGRTCREGFCEVQCVIDSDCRKSAADGGHAEEASCVVGECQTPSGSASCSSEADCAFDEACVDAHCASREAEPQLQ
jgi:hypothetical protein